MIAGNSVVMKPSEMTTHVMLPFILLLWYIMIHILWLCFIYSGDVNDDDDDNDYYTTLIYDENDDINYDDNDNSIYTYQHILKI